jgi:undecaprenyl-diphosphatase
MFQNIIEILILSLVQGVSEFLPISSSAHLIIIETLYDFKNSSLLIDISLHLGSLTAIIFYFRKDLLNLKNNQQLLTLILIGSLPVIITGFILYQTEIIYLLRDIKIIAWTTLIFGILLFLADKNNFNKKISSDLNLKSILLIGLFQILSLIPGVSRAGITITAARILKFNRVDSSKISFLLSIPALGGASFLGLKDLIKESFELNYLVFLAIVTSFIFSYMTVKFFLIYINKFSMNIFVIYRIIICCYFIFINLQLISIQKW